MKNTYMSSWSAQNHGEQCRLSSVFTWSEKTVDETGEFSIDFNKDRFWIRSILYPESYLDTSHVTHAHASAIPRYSPKAAVRIILSDGDTENCYIQNYYSNRYMYAGDNNTKEDSQRRTIFTNGSRENNQSSYLWKLTGS